MSDCHLKFANLKKKLLHLLQDGLVKLVPLAISVICLGIIVNTVNRTVSITQDKLQENTSLCKSLATKLPVQRLKASLY